MPAPVQSLLPIGSPRVSRVGLAREGVRFTDFYSNGPVCTPTRAGLMTGRHQQRMGLEWALLPNERQPGLRRPSPRSPACRQRQGIAVDCGTS